MMKHFALLLLIAAAGFGQARQNTVQTGVVDARGANWIPPKAMFANPPSAPPAGSVYVFDDANSSGSCTGGGSAAAICRWNGSSWDALGGGGGAAQASLLSGGTQVQRSVQCASGAVPYTMLQSLTDGVSGEVTIQTGVSGNMRWDQVLISETTQFAGLNGLTVSMGRPGTTNHDEMTGAMVPLMVSGGDANYWSTRPIPPQITSTYSIVLNFAVPTYYNAGTVTVTNGSTAITGSGTVWTSSMTGMYIALSGVYYQFTYVSPTSGTLGTPYAGTTQSGLSNPRLQNFPKQATAGSLTWEVCGYAAR